MDVWDGKYDHHFRDQLPDSLSKSVLDLTPAERVAIIHLGFATYDEYRKRFTKNVSQFADYAF
jgi:ribosome recycling factor